MKKQEKNNKSSYYKTNKTLKTATQTYCVVICLSFWACLTFYQNLSKIFSLNHLPMPMLDLVAITTLVVLISLALGYVFDILSPTFRIHKKITEQLIGRIKTYQVFYLSLLAAFSEEMLFRATLQSSLGILLTSTIVGLLHIGPHVTFSLWTLMGFIRSLLFGVLFHYTKSIYPCIVAHFILNLIHLFKHQYEMNKLTKKVLSKS
jgi:membrane protease YdiL (CAAX protease family)